MLTAKHRCTFGSKSLAPHTTLVRLKLPHSDTRPFSRKIAIAVFAKAIGIL